MLTGAVNAVNHEPDYHEPMNRQNSYENLLFIVMVCVFITFFCTGCQRSEKIPQLSGDIDYNLLIITIDTLRADRLGCYGFANAQTPTIDGLAEKGIIFKHCYSPAPITLPAYCTVFTGKTPIAHGARNNSTYFLPGEEMTLAEILKEQGFQTHAVISLPTLGGKFGLNQGFQVYDDSLDFRGGADYIRGQIRAHSVYARFKSWFAGERRHQERFFSWIHFSDPHAPYDPPKKYRQRFETDPYSGEIAVVDHYIGKIIQDLESENILDKTLIIITSGHGEAFGEHNEFGHGIFCYNESLKVPLIFANPAISREGKKVYQRVNLADIMPTVLQLFAIENPAAVQGRSLAPLFKGKEPGEKTTPTPPHYFESMIGKEEMNLAPLTGIIADRYKYISLPEAELYDLNKDPLEKENLFKQEQQLAKELESQLQEYIAAHAQPRLQPSTSVQQQTAAAAPGLTPMDPKNAIHTINQLIRVKKEITNGNIPGAKKELVEMSDKSPGTSLPYFYEYLHDVYREQGDLQKAEETLKNGIASSPAAAGLKLKLASFYMDRERMDQAEDICRGLLAENPRFTEAGLLLRRIYKKKGKINDEVQVFYERTLKEEPLNALARVEYAEILLARGEKEPVLDIVSTLMENDVLMNDTENPDIKTGMGMLLLKMGQYDRAITLCLHMTSQGHKSPQVLNQLGKAYSGKGDFEKALAAYSSALELDEKNALTLSNLGTLYLTLFRVKRERDMHARAIEYYSRALEADPGMVPALNGLAVAYSFAGNANKAVEYWEKAIAINPGFTNVYFNLGITYLRMGKKKKALKYLHQLKNRLYNRLSLSEQQQVDNLIKEAGQ
ncbi:MAG: sulfatase-like hydrolase/transferase [Candidatus Aminicenantes bacterium]|nr:MAG: sulfatase-like hydrolase/transferase [Candidatus Aminicenantes bacterium]